MKPMNYSSDCKITITKRLAGNCVISYKFIQIALLCCCSVSVVLAQKQTDKHEKAESAHSGHSGHGHESATNLKHSPVRQLVIPDVEVLTQDGKQVKFFTDLVKGKKVLINFIYTSCGLTCPMAGRNFDKLQRYIEKDFGEEVFLISVSTDPTVDTPEVIKQWGEKFNRQSIWTLVTGEKSKMEQLLTALTGSGVQRGQHTSLLILFDEATGAWETSSSLREPKILLDDLSKLKKPPAH